MLQTCNKCGTVRAITDFYRHPGTASGFKRQCKYCCREYQRANRADNLEYYREYDRSRGGRTTSEDCRAYRAANPLKYKSHQAVNYALRAGALVKPSVCEDCGAEGRVDGHHEDYSRPLSVDWLCRPCHCARHANETF